MWRESGPLPVGDVVRAPLAAGAWLLGAPPQLAAELRTAFPQVEVHEGSARRRGGPDRVRRRAGGPRLQRAARAQLPRRVWTERIEVSDRAARRRARRRLRAHAHRGRTFVGRRDRGVSAAQARDARAASKPVLVFEHRARRRGPLRHRLRPHVRAPARGPCRVAAAVDLDADGPLSRERFAERFAWRCAGTSSSAPRAGER